MEKMENIEADVSSRKRRHSLVKQSDSISTSYSVYFDSTPKLPHSIWWNGRITPMFRIRTKKKIFQCTPDFWKIWYEESLVDYKKVLKLFVVCSDVMKFSHPVILTVQITTAQSPKGHFETFNIENPKESYTFYLDAPSNDEFEMWIWDFRATLNGDILTDRPFEFRFDNDEHQHDIVLNFGDKKLYCNKVVLAIVSNYFDRLFFSETGDPSMKSCDLLDLTADGVMFMLNACLADDSNNSYQVAHEFDIRQIQALLFLEIWNFKNDTRKIRMPQDPCQRFLGIEMEDSFANIMTGLELEDKYGLKDLEISYVLRYHFSIEQRKAFFAQYVDRLNKLDSKVLSGLINEVFKIYEPEPEPQPESEHEPGSEPESESEPDPDPDPESEPELENTEAEATDRNIDKLTDVTLLVGDQKFRVHKAYLAFWSPFFDRLFFGGFCEARKDEIELKDVDPKEFDVLLKKIYSPRKVAVDESNFTFLLELADRFGMKSLMIMCGRYLNTIIERYFFIERSERSEIPFIDLLELADTYNLIDAQRRMVEKASANVKSMAPKN